nr:hypothetical protein BSM_03780 [uncultured archaeon]
MSLGLWIDLSIPSMNRSLTLGNISNFFFFRSFLTNHHQIASWGVTQIFTRNYKDGCLTYLHHASCINLQIFT